MSNDAAAIEAMRSVPSTTGHLRRGDFEATDYAGTGAEETILELEANQPLGLRNGQRYRLAIVASETFTTDGTADDTQTVSLSSDFIDSDVTNPNAVAYVDNSGDGTPDTRAAVSAEDYGNNTVDVADEGTTNAEGVVYYAVGAQASVKLRKVGPGGSNSETLIEHDASLLNNRDPNRDPLRFNLNASELQPVIPTDWSLVLNVSGPFPVGIEDPEAVNLLVSLPIRRSRQSEIEGLAGAVRRDSAGRI
jgi:hypothetical protein